MARTPAPRGTNTERVTLRLPEPLYDWLVDTAHQERVTVTSKIIAALEALQVQQQRQE